VTALAGLAQDQRPQLEHSTDDDERRDLRLVPHKPTKAEIYGVGVVCRSQMARSRRREHQQDDRGHKVEDGARESHLEDQLAERVHRQNLRHRPVAPQRGDTTVTQQTLLTCVVQSLPGLTSEEHERRGHKASEVKRGQLR
jgi:hypothetical protein